MVRISFFSLVVLLLAALSVGVILRNRGSS